MLNQIKLLIRYRHLVLDLAVKDIKVRYRSQVLGFLWAILVPLATVFTLKFIFSTVLKVNSGDYPFFIYLSTAVFPWTYFNSSLGNGTESLVNNRNLIKNTSFPRQVIPVSVVLANLINFFPALLTMICLLVIFRMPFTGLILLLPLVILLQTMLAIGLVLMFSSLQVVLRDVKYIVELLLMIWMYLSPVFYTLTEISRFSPLILKIYLLNPFVGLFCIYRVALLKDFTRTLPEGVSIYWVTLWAALVCVAVFFLGFFIFKKYERHFSDLV